MEYTREDVTKMAKDSKILDWQRSLHPCVKCVTPTYFTTTYRGDCANQAYAMGR